MTTTVKLLTAMPLALLIAGCVPANDPISSNAELEATLDQDIDGDNMVDQDGV